MAGKCASCQKVLAREVLVDVPSHLVVTKTKDKDGNRNVITDLSAVACQELCYFCYGKAQKVQQTQCDGNTDVIYVNSKEFVSFCEVYSDICSDHGIADCKDKYGKQSVRKTDANDKFMQGKHVHIDVGAYFTDIIEYVEDEKKSELQKGGTETTSNSTTNNRAPVESTHNTRFTVEEIAELIKFINAKEFDGISIKRFLEENKYIEYLQSKNMKPRNSVESYVQTYASLN